MKKAIVYSLNQKEYLCTFLSHGEIEISNNQVENSIRPIVVGRKNWLFCDTQAGANASVIIFTLLETAKANGLNPEAYLNRLLTVLPERTPTTTQRMMIAVSSRITRMQAIMPSSFGSLSQWTYGELRAMA